MATEDLLYDEDLAYIHAVGFGEPGRKAAAEIVRLLRSAPAPVRHVLDLGCGSGVLTGPLLEGGFEVTGVDSSAALLAMAAAENPGARFRQASIYTLELSPCDAILAIGEPLTYHGDRRRADGLVREFFERSARALPRGGVLIFDLIESEGPPLAGRFWSSGADWAVLSETAEEREAGVLIRRIETFRQVDGHYRRGRETHRVALFDAAVVAGWLGDCGFSVDTAAGYGSALLPPRRRAFLCVRQ